MNDNADVRLNVDGLEFGEKPVETVASEHEIANNGLYRLVEAEFVFTNPNARVFAGELEMTLPEGATVCGYRLQIGDEMVPGTVVEKEKARVAFENEQRQGTDPGIVEQVKGNIWRTRIYPLRPGEPRRAAVSYIVPISEGEVKHVVERWADEVFVGERIPSSEERMGVREQLAAAENAWIFWDASRSRRGKTAIDRMLLAGLPAKGRWSLVVFRNRPESPIAFDDREALLRAVDEVVYDGGTDIAAALRSIPDDGTAKFLFSDGEDTLSEGFTTRGMKGVVFASKEEAPRNIVVRKASADEAFADGEVRDGELLAVAWAAAEVAELSTDAEANRARLIELGRRYGVASPITSMIVFETVEQWLKHKVEPPKELSIHSEWARRRKAQDDDIDELDAAEDHRRELLRYWKERVEWWNKPKPEVRRPSSGLFSRMASSASSSRRASASMRMGNGGLAISLCARSPARAMRMARMEMASRVRSESATADGVAYECCMDESCPMPGRGGEESMVDRDEASAGAMGATVKIAAWDPKAKYLKTIAKSEDPYAEYLKEAESHGNSPAFYLDCAGFFFKAGRRETAIRVISNLAEFKLEDAALWRVMGWRLREAGAYDEAVRAFRHVFGMRGEEGQSHRDLAMVLMERGKASKCVEDLEEAMQRFHDAAFRPHARRAAWRGNDMQVSVVALEELNGLITWCERQKWSGHAPKVPELEKAFRRELPTALRIVLSWDADETDVDLHVLEPNGEEAYYANRRTAEGGFVSEDVTTGYGPEEYLRKDAAKGEYQILAHYFASHQQKLVGAVTVTATVYVNWATRNESMRIMTLRLDKPRDRHMVGAVEM